MKNIFLLLAGLLLPYLVFSQGENNNWYFGSYAGITFNTNPPSAITDGQVDTFEGVASISNSEGDLLFYTDGYTIWNREHEPMENGEGLTGSSTSQQTIILPFPGQPQKYFVFTMGSVEYLDGFPEENPISYSIVDMTQGDLDNNPTNPQPLGAVDINYKNISIKDEFGQNLTSLFRSEAITAIQHSDNSSYWVLIPNGNTLYSYRLHYYGLEEIPVTSEISVCLCQNEHAQIKISPNLDNVVGYTNFISIAQWGRDEEEPRIAIYSFDNNTGMVTPHYEVLLESTPNKYASEFNSDGTLLYASQSQNSRVIVVDLLSLNFREVFAGFPPGGNPFGGTIQRGVDNNLYYAMFNKSYLAQIINPDSYLYSNINLNNNNYKINLGGNYCRLGLPQLVPFLTDNVCLDNLTLISPETHQNITYQVSNIITTKENYITYGTSINPLVTMKAGHMIEFLPETYINNRCFWAKIEECPNEVSVRPTVESGSYVRATINLDEVMAEIDSQLHIYPNPSSEIINISSTNIIDNVTITDLNGRTVKQVTAGVNEAQINISDLAQGVYILNASSNGKSFTQKIVKQ